MINIYLNRNNIVFAILLTLVLWIVLINIKTYKEGFIFTTLKIKDSCLPKKKVSRPRPNYQFQPKCFDIIIPTKNTPKQKEFINKISKDVELPENEIDELIPNDLVKFKEDIIKVAKLLVVRDTYINNGDFQEELETLIANTLYDVDKPELIKEAPNIKLLLQSTSINSLIKPLEGEKKEKKILEIENSKEIIQEETIELTPEEDTKIRTTFNTYSQRCGVSLI